MGKLFYVILFLLNQATQKYFEHKKCDYGIAIIINTAPTYLGR